MISLRTWKKANRVSPEGKRAGHIITLRAVSKVYKVDGGASVTAARDVNLAVREGEFIVITGRSGAGKTTLLNLAAGLTRPSAGEVLIDGVDIWRLGDREQALLRNQKIGFVFQFPSLLSSLTALENVVLPTMFGPKEAREGALHRAAGLLHDVGLGEKMDAYPRQLSAGQQKRVVIARSMINRPEILIADEPTGDLDEQTEREVMDLLRAAHEAAGLTVLLVTHNRNLVPYATRHLELADGSIVAGS